MDKSSVRRPGSAPRGRRQLRTPNPIAESLPESRLNVEAGGLRDRPRTPDYAHRTLIIGYGNPLRSDDGFGWHASRLLANTLAGQDVDVITCHQLTPELAELLSQCRRAVFIDAQAAGKPGEIRRRAARPLASARSCFTHTCTPSGLLASARQLYGRYPQGIVVTVSAQSLEFGDALSPVVSAALLKVAEQVCKWAGLAVANHTLADV